MYIKNKYYFIILCLLSINILLSDQDSFTSINSNPIGSVGVVAKYDSELDSEMEDYFINFFIDELDKRNLYSIKDVDSIKNRYNYIVETYRSERNNYPAIIDFLDLDFLILINFYNYSQSNQNGESEIKLSFKIRAIRKHSQNSFGIINQTVTLANFNQILTYIPQIVDKFEENISIVTVQGSPKESNIILMDDYNNIIHSNSGVSFSQKVASGQYNMFVQKKGYIPMDGIINPNPGQHLKLSYDLKLIDKKHAKTLALLYPGMGHSYLKQKQIATAFSVVQTTFLALSTYFLFDYFTQDDNWKDVGILYSQDPYGGGQYIDELQSLYDKRSRSFNLFLTFSSTSSVTWVLNYFDINNRLNKADVGIIIPTNKK